MLPERDEAFRALRPKLFGIAYRMLQVRADAEDAVQEAWLRLSRANGVESVEGFLTTTVTRICIDELRSARMRRERYVGPWLPEPLRTPTGGLEKGRLSPAVDAEETVGGASAPLDPEEHTERAELLSIALLQIVERLEPVERAVFLLREAFAYPYAEIAEIVGRREDHCRQIAKRATARVRSERPTPGADPATHARLLEGFLSAAADGDLAALEALLTEDVVLCSDGGGKVAAARNPIVGSDRTARFIAGVARKQPADTKIEYTTLNGDPAAVVRVGAHTVVTVSIDVADGRIRRVFMVRNPDKLRRL